MPTTTAGPGRPHAIGGVVHHEEPADGTTLALCLVLLSPRALTRARDTET